MPAPYVAVADGYRIEGRVIGRSDPRIEIRIFDIADEERYSRAGDGPLHSRNKACVLRAELPPLGLADLANWVTVLTRKLVLASEAAKLPTGPLAHTTRMPDPINPAPDIITGVMERWRALGHGANLKLTREEEQAFRELQLRLIDHAHEPVT